MRNIQGRLDAGTVLFCGFMILLFMAPAHAQQRASDKNAGRKAEFEQWEKIYNDLYNSRTIKDEAEKEKVIKKFREVDTDKMSPEWRLEFLSRRLIWDQLNGDWNDMLAIRDRLMNKKRASKTDSLLDVDLLFYIYYLYTSTGFAPPKDSVKGSPVEDSSEYWEKHYKSDKEAERIMQYVVDNFDENYVKVAEARINLASLQYAQEKYALALKNYQLFEAIDTKKLYALPTMGRDGAEILVTKEKNLKDGLNSINYSMGFARVGIIRATVYSDRARAVKALDALSVKYKNDEKAMAEIKEQLDEIARRKAAEAEIEEFRKRINLQKMKK